MSIPRPLLVRRLAVVLVAGATFTACGVSAKNMESGGPVSTPDKGGETTTSVKLDTTTAEEETTTSGRRTATTDRRTSTIPSRPTTTTGKGGGGGGTLDIDLVCSVDDATLEDIVGGPLDKTDTTDPGYCSWFTEDYDILNITAFSAYGETDPAESGMFSGSTKSATLSGGEKVAYETDSDGFTTAATIVDDTLITVMSTAQVDSVAILQAVVDAAS